MVDVLKPKINVKSFFITKRLLSFVSYYKCNGKKERIHRRGGY